MTKKMYVVIVRTVFMAAMVSISPHFVQARDIHVPTDYKTIQSAIEASRDGDVVIVEPGTYVQNINFLSRAITVRSKDPWDPDIVSKTIINGGEFGTTIYFWGKEGRSTILAGFTIMGTPSEDISRPRALSIEDSSPTLIRCTFVDKHPSKKSFFFGFLASNASLIQCTAILPGWMTEREFISPGNSRIMYDSFMIVEDKAKGNIVPIDNKSHFAKREKFLAGMRPVNDLMLGVVKNNYPRQSQRCDEVNGNYFVVYAGKSIQINVAMISRFVDYEGDGVMSWPFTTEVEWMNSPLNPGQIGTFLPEHLKSILDQHNIPLPNNQPWPQHKPFPPKMPSPPKKD